jgi:hypothetical protein
MRFPFTIALALGLLAAAPARADCGVDHAFVDRQITQGIFRPNRFAAPPPEIPVALRLIGEGRRDEAKVLFAAISKTPEAEWRRDMTLAAIVLDAGWSAWLLDGCPD